MKKTLITALSTLLIMSANVYAVERPQNIIVCAHPSYLEAAHIMYDKYGKIFFDGIKEYTKNRCESIERINESVATVNFLASSIIDGKRVCSIEIVVEGEKTMPLYTINTEESPMCDYYKKDE